MLLVYEQNTDHTVKWLIWQWYVGLCVIVCQRCLENPEQCVWSSAWRRPFSCTLSCPSTSKDLQLEASLFTINYNKFMLTSVTTTAALTHFTRSQRPIRRYWSKAPFDIGAVGGWGRTSPYPPPSPNSLVTGLQRELCDMKHCSSNLKHQHIRAKSSVLWPSKYARTRYRPAGGAHDASVDP